MPNPNLEAESNSSGIEDERAIKLKELEVRRVEAEKALWLSKGPWWKKADPLILAIIAAVFTPHWQHGGRCLQ